SGLRPRRARRSQHAPLVVLGALRPVEQREIFSRFSQSPAVHVGRRLKQFSEGLHLLMSARLRLVQVTDYFQRYASFRTEPFYPSSSQLPLVPDESAVRVHRVWCVRPVDDHMSHVEGVVRLRKIRINEGRYVPHTGRGEQGNI